LDQKRLDEFLLATCKPVYRSGTARPLNPKKECEDEPRWQPKDKQYQSLMIRNGRLMEIGAFGQPRPVGRPPGPSGKRLSWELPKIR
jgi:hypothetical protein